MTSQIIPVLKVQDGPTSPRSTWWLTVSCCIYFSIVCCGYFIFIPIFAQLFKGLGVDLPFPANLLMLTYWWSLPVFYLFACGVAFVKQFVALDGVRSRLANLILIFAGILLPPLIVLCMYLPLFLLSHQLHRLK